MSYTKGKWAYFYEGSGDYLITSKNGEDVASLSRPDAHFLHTGKGSAINEANAKRIVHCVNNYDGLVEALKEIAKDGCPADIEIAKQTLAKAEEE